MATIATIAITIIRIMDIIITIHIHIHITLIIVHIRHTIITIILIIILTGITVMVTEATEVRTVRIQLAEGVILPGLLLLLQVYPVHTVGGVPVQVLPQLFQGLNNLTMQPVVV